MKSCRIDTHYTKSGEPNSMYKDSFLLYVSNDPEKQGPTIWRGSYGQVNITVTQRNRQSDIKEEDIIFEKNPAYKEDSNITKGVPSKEFIAKTLNNHLDNIYN